MLLHSHRMNMHAVSIDEQLNNFFLFTNTRPKIANILTHISDFIPWTDIEYFIMTTYFIWPSFYVIHWCTILVCHAVSIGVHPRKDRDNFPWHILLFVFRFYFFFCLLLFAYINNSYNFPIKNNRHLLNFYLTESRNKAHLFSY